MILTDERRRAKIFTAGGVTGLWPISALQTRFTGAFGT